MSKWTKAELNGLRERMAAHGRGAEEIAEEIRYHCRCSKLTAYRLAQGLSQPQAVARYEQATGRTMSQPVLSKLENRRRRWRRATSASSDVVLQRRSRLARMT